MKIKYGMVSSGAIEFENLAKNAKRRSKKLNIYAIVLRNFVRVFWNDALLYWIDLTTLYHAHKMRRAYQYSEHTTHRGGHHLCPRVRRTYDSHVNTSSNVYIPQNSNTDRTHRYASLALEIESFSKAVFSLRFMDRTTWFYSSLHENKRLNDVFVPRAGQDLIYDRKRQIRAESEMSSEDRLVASELGANRLFWRGNNPVLCVAEEVKYVCTGKVPMAVVSVRLVGNADDYDPRKQMKAEIETHCKLEHRKPLARLLGNIIVSLREEFDTSAFERIPTEKQAPDYESSLNLKKIERRVVNGRYATVQEFYQDIVRVATYFARYWIDIMEYEQLECVPRLLLSTTVLFLRQNADEEFFIDTYAGTFADDQQVKIRTGKRKCQRNGDFPYTGLRVCMEHTGFVRTGVVKGFYHPTATTEPLWLVEFDSENQNDATLIKVVNLRQVHRGITVSMSRDLLESRNKLRKDRHAESLTGSRATTDFIGDHGKSITVTGTSSTVTAHLDSLLSVNSNLFDRTQHEKISTKGFQVQEENGTWRDCVLYRHITSQRIVLSFGDGTFEGLTGKPYKLEMPCQVFDGDAKSGKLLDSDGDLIPTRCTANGVSSTFSGKTKLFSRPVVESNENVATMESGEYRCEKCGKTYNHKSSLWYHLKYVICGFMYNDRSNTNRARSNTDTRYVRRKH